MKNEKKQHNNFISVFEGIGKRDDRISANSCRGCGGTILFALSLVFSHNVSSGQ
jgi:hypothetical protein